MSLDSLHHKVDKLIERVQPQEPQEQEPLDLSVFTEQEQARFASFLAGIHPLSEGRGLRELPASDFFTLGLWYDLYEALIHQDEKRIAGYRYRLQFSTQQVIDLFLSLSAHGETDDELHQYTPFGLLYSGLVHVIHQSDTKMLYHNLDEIWQWCVKAHLVESLYHKNLRWDA